MLSAENGNLTCFKCFICYPIKSCGFVSYIFLKNTESQTHEEEGGAGSGKVRDATEKGD